MMIWQFLFEPDPDLLGGDVVQIHSLHDLSASYVYIIQLFPFAINTKEKKSVENLFANRDVGLIKIVN